MVKHETKEAISDLFSDILLLCVEDIEKGIPERHASNTGETLGKRLGINRYFPNDIRNGDSKYARSLYTAAYWLLTTHSQK